MVGRRARVAVQVALLAIAGLGGNCQKPPPRFAPFVSIGCPTGDPTTCLSMRPTCADNNGTDGNVRCVNKVCYFTPDPNNIDCKCVAGDADSCGTNLYRTCVASKSGGVGQGNEAADWGPCQTPPPPPPPQACAPREWSLLSSDPTWQHQCGFDCGPPSTCPVTEPARGKPWMGTRTGSDNPCLAQFGAAVQIPKGRYNVVFDVWPRGKTVTAILEITRNGVLVDPPGRGSIAANDGSITSYSRELTVPDDCAASYDFRVSYKDDGATPPAGYVEVWATKLVYLGP